MKSLVDLCQRKEKISMVTCYDYLSANIVSDTDIDLVLVGDSAAMVVHGYEGLDEISTTASTKISYLKSNNSIESMAYTPAAPW